MDELTEMQARMKAVLSLARRTCDAYSASIWGAQMWVAAVEMLLDMGLSEEEAEEVLRSKMTRWARDAYGPRITWLGRLCHLVTEERQKGATKAP